MRLWQLDCVQTFCKLGTVFENFGRGRLTWASQGTVGRAEGRSHWAASPWQVCFNFLSLKFHVFTLSSLKWWHKGYDKRVKIASDSLMSARTEHPGAAQGGFSECLSFLLHVAANLWSCPECQIPSVRQDQCLNMLFLLQAHRGLSH